jgi:hypothetical protein
MYLWVPKLYYLFCYFPFLPLTPPPIFHSSLFCALRGQYPCTESLRRPCLLIPTCILTIEGNSRRSMWTGKRYRHTDTDRYTECHYTVHWLEHSWDTPGWDLGALFLAGAAALQHIPIKHPSITTPVPRHCAAPCGLQCLDMSPEGGWRAK